MTACGGQSITQARANEHKVERNDMPLTLTLTEGVLPAGTENQAIEELTKSMLERH